MFFLLVKYFMKYFSILTVSFEIFQTIFILHTFTLTDTLRKNKSSVMVADTITQSPNLAETWIGKIGCRRDKPTIAFYPFTVSKVTNVGIN